MSRRNRALPWLAVAAGAAVGTSARYGADLLLPHPVDAVPWSTIVVNTVGAFLLGLLAAKAWARVPEWVRAGLGAGLLGSFTTFSTLMVAALMIARRGATDGALDPGSIWLAVAVIAGSVVAGLLAAFFGIVIGAGRTPRRLDSREDA